MNTCQDTKEKKLEPYPFQQQAVKKMVGFLMNNPERGCYNATEQGLGKTIETIETVKAFAFRSVLIICPAIMIQTWQKEIRTWDPQASVVLGLPERGAWTVSNLGIANRTYKIVSYNKATSNVLGIEIQNFDCLVLDEAHYVKNSKAKRTKAILGQLWPKIPYRICLSGTPFTRSVADGYTLFSRLCPSAFPDFRAFTECYTHPLWDGFQMRYEGIKNEKELSKVIRSNFYLRDTKAEVAKDLPPKIWCRITLPSSLDIKHDETEEEKRAHEHYIAILRKTIAAGSFAPPPPKAVATKRREQSLKKVKAVAEFAKELLEQSLPVVIFAHHLDITSELRKLLDKYQPGVLTGEQSTKNREQDLTNFKKGGMDLMLCSYQAAGVGIDLTRASNVILAEWDYTPSVISQAVARCHRLTTKYPVNIYYFVVDGSLEEDIIEMSVKKHEAFEKVIEN